MACMALALAPVAAQEGGPQQNSGPSGASAADVKQLFDAASDLIARSRYAEAARLLRQAEALAPGESSVHHYLAYALWKQDQWGPAETEFQKAHQLDPQNPYTLYFLARIAQSTGKPGESIRDYEAILRLGPAIYDTDQQLGQLYFDHGQIEKAREHIEQALKQTPWESSLYFQLGKIDQKTGRAAAAREEFSAAERLKNVGQQSVQHLLELDRAASDHDAGQIDSLRTALLAEASQDPEILQSVGVLLGRAGLYDQAREPLKRCVKLDPESFEAEYNLGVTLLRLHSDREAEASLLAALKLHPDSVEANRGLAVLYVGQNRNLEAIERLRAVNRASAGDGKILSLLGQQYLQGHFVKDAIATLQQAAELAPRDPGVRLLLAQAYRALNEDDQGLKAAQEALGISPDSGPAAYEVAQELAALGRYEDARPYAERAAKKQPDLAEAWNLLGDLDSKSGKYEAALEDFRQAQSLDASNLDAARGVADNLIHLRRYDEARTQLRKDIDDHPQDARLYFSLVQLYTRTGDREAASKAAAVYQELHAHEVAQHDAQTPRAYTPSPALPQTSKAEEDAPPRERRGPGGGVK